MAADQARIDLYELLPATYRIDDASQGYPLRALMDLISEQANLLKEDISGLHDDLFIETCAEWVLPYIGDLIANNPLYEAVRGRRADVAKTIYYRRRKGTLPMLEELARDITGWSAHAVAFFEQLGWTQNLNHIRYEGASDPLAHDPNAANRVGTAHVRNVDAMDRLDGPFDITTHTVDVRRISRTQGWYNIKKIGFFLWRLESYRMQRSDARQSSTPHAHGWHFSPLGNPAPLFTLPEAELSETGLSTEIHVRAPIRALAFHDDLAAARRVAEAGGYRTQPEVSQYFGANRSIGISIGNQPPMRPLDVVCMDLSGWERPPAAISGIFSGVLGPINLAAATPEVNVTIGSEGTHRAVLPSGALTLAAAASALESGIRHAAATRGFTGTRVILHGSQLLVIPGMRGDPVNFSATVADAATVGDLQLNAAAAQTASGVMSGDLSTFPKSFTSPPQLEVTMGAQPPQVIALAAAPSDLADAAAKIQNALQLVALPEFATAQALVVGSHLLLLPGVAGVPVRVRSTLNDPSTAELLKLTSKTGVDVRLGRFAFAIGDEPAPSSRVQVDYNYGFSANLGGGPYDRRDLPQRLGQAARERPDTVRYPTALGKLIRVPADALTISGAIALWHPLTDPRAVIQIEDNRTYVENLSVSVPGGELILQAGNQRRPTLVGNIDVTAAGGEGRFRLDGFWVAGKLSVNGDLGELALAHATLVPGLTLDESGAPILPDTPSLEIMSTNAHLRTIINHSITGSIQAPPEAVSLEIRDSIVDTSRKEGRAIVVPALISGAFSPFPASAAPPTLRLTIGDEGPLTIMLSGVPADRTQARTMLEAAIHAASTSPGFANAQVLSRNNQFFVLSGDSGRVFIQSAPGDDTAEKWRLVSPAARESFGLLSGPLTAPITLTNPTPAVALIKKISISGTTELRNVDLTDLPASPSLARKPLEDAIRAADVATEFTSAEVFLIGNQFLILPGGSGAAASFVHQPSDTTSLLELKFESARPSIAGSAGGELPSPPTILENVTIFGSSHFRELTLASNVIFQQPTYADRRQAGCIRFSYIPPGSRTPRRYRCQPDLALEGITDPAARAIITNRLRPAYTSVHYGDPGYAQLGLECTCEIKTGAENGSEMGAFNSLMQPQREMNLHIRLEEYLPFGLEPGLIYMT